MTALSERQGAEISHGLPLRGMPLATVGATVVTEAGTMRRIALELSNMEYVALAFRALHYRRSVPDQIRREMEQGMWETRAIARLDQQGHYDHRSEAQQHAGSHHLFVEIR